MDTLPTAPFTPPHTSKKSIFLPILVLFIALLAVLAVFFLSTQTRTSTESRSRAGDARAGFILNAPDSSHAQAITLQSPSAENVTLTTFDIVLEFSLPEDILGIQDEERETATLRRAVEAFKKVTATPTTSGVVITPCYNQVVQGVTLSWPNSCRGIPGTNCQADTTPLTTAEQERYTIWTRHGRPQIPGCPVTSKPTPTMNSIPSAPTATPLLPVTTEKDIFSSQGLVIRTALSEVITFEPVTVERSPGTNIGRVRVHGKVTRPSSQTDQQLIRSTTPFLHISAPANVEARLVSASIKGTYATAPGVEVELSNPSTTP